MTQSRLTFLVPVFNEETSLPQLFHQFEGFWQRHAARVVFVNDGSSDESLAVLNHFQSRARIDVCIVDLARNFGKDRAIQAGISEVEPDSALVLMDADCQHTVAAVESIVSALNDRDVDIVFGTRDRADYQGFRDRAASEIFYAAMNLGSKRGQSASRYIDDRIGDFFAAKSNVVQALQQYRAPRPAWKGYYAYMGFQSALVPVEIDRRQDGQSKFSPTKRVGLALDTVTGFTVWPLRALLATGLVVLATCLLSTAWILGRYLLTGQTANGYYTILLAVMLLGSLNLVAVGVVSEYLIGVISSANGLPNQLVRETSDRRVSDTLQGSPEPVPALDLSAGESTGGGRDRHVDTTNR